MKRDWEKVWQGSMGIALPVAFVSAVMDRTLLLTVMDLWENLTAWRWLFFLSSAFLLIGLARNSARLRRLLRRQAAGAAAEAEPADSPRPNPSGREFSSSLQ